MRIKNLVKQTLGATDQRRFGASIDELAPYPILFFDWSRDGKFLAYANGTMTSDVVIITDAR